MVASAKSSETNGNAPLTEKSVAAAHEAIDGLSERLSKTEKSMRDMVSDSGGNLSGRQQELRSKFDSTLNDAQNYIQENPLAAAGMAFTAGVVLASLMRR